MAKSFAFGAFPRTCGPGAAPGACMEKQLPCRRPPFRDCQPACLGLLSPECHGVTHGMILTLKKVGEPFRLFVTVMGPPVPVKGPPNGDQFWPFRLSVVSI